jgi:hypothetical protein
MGCMMVVSPRLLSLGSSVARCFTPIILTPSVCFKAHCLKDPDALWSEVLIVLGWDFCLALAFLSSWS